MQRYSSGRYAEPLISNHEAVRDVYWDGLTLEEFEAREAERRKQKKLQQQKPQSQNQSQEK